MNVLWTTPHGSQGLPRQHAAQMLCLLGVLFYAHTTHAQDLQRAREAAISIHEEGKFPSELPRKSLPQEVSSGPGLSKEALDSIGVALLTGASLVQWAFIALAVVLVIFFALAIFRLRPRVDHSNKAQEAKRSRKSPSKISITTDPDQLSDEGLARLLQQQRYALAVAYLLKLIIYELGYDRGAEQLSLTPREVSTHLRLADLMSAVQIAEKVRFAGESASTEHIEQLQALRKALQSQARRGETSDAAH